MSYVLGSNGYFNASISWTPSAGMWAAIWFKKTSDANYRNLIAMYGSAAARLSFYVEGSTRFQVCQFRNVSGVSGNAQTSSGQYTSGSWAIAIARFIDSNDESRILTTAGDSAGTENSGLNFPGEALTSLYIGSNNSPGDYLNGRIGFVAIGQGALTADDVTDLKAGAYPTALSIQPTYLWDWINGTSLTDSISSLTLTANGTTTSGDSDNPTVDGPPGGGSAVPLLMQMYSGS